MFNNIELDNIEGIGYHTIDNKKYITTKDLEKITGIKKTTIRAYKLRNQLKEVDDYIMYDGFIMINIESNFIISKAIKFQSK